jgi:hypothetical protein
MQASQKTTLLIISMMAPLMNKIKLNLRHAKKNRKLALKLTKTLDALAEQLLPQFLMEKKHDYITIKKIHTMCFLLASKVQRVFNSRVIHTIMDKNWDMKGMKDVLN